jgi:hypothetical protein
MDTVEIWEKNGVKTASLVSKSWVIYVIITNYNGRSRLSSAHSSRKRVLIYRHGIQLLSDASVVGLLSLGSVSG